MTGNRCPFCKQTGTQCRNVDRGWWCQVDGLQEDPSRWIYPTPDPVVEAVDRNSDVVAARQAQEVAQAEYERCEAEWHRVLSERLAAKIKSEVTSYSANGSFVRHSQPILQEKIEELEAREQEILRERDRAHETLVEANTAYRRARANVWMELSGEKARLEEMTAGSDEQ